jgi:hypothetical protein
MDEMRPESLKRPTIGGDRSRGSRQSRPRVICPADGQRSQLRERRGDFRGPRLLRRDKLAGTFQAGRSRVRGMLGRFTARMLVERVRSFGCAQPECRGIHRPGMRMMQAAPAHNVEGDQPDRQSVQHGLHCRKPSADRQVGSGMWPKGRRKSELSGAKRPRYPRLSGKKPFLPRELFLGGQCPLFAARKESTDGRTMRR